VRLVAGLGLALCATAAAAQPTDTRRATPGQPVSLADYTLTNWSEDEGRFPFGVYALAQDRDGYLWVGARSGIIRFDGSEFVPWKGRPSLPSDRVTAILSARDRSIWVGFGTVGGVARIFEGKAQLFTTADGMAEGHINSIVEDGLGNVWVASYKGLSEYDGERWRTLGEAEGLPAEPALRVWCDPGDRLWVLTAAGLYRREPNQPRFTFIEAGRDGDIGQDLAGTVWVSDPKDAIHRVGSPATAERSSLGHVARGRVLLFDRSGALWVGTRGAGLMRVHGDAAGVDPQRTEFLTRRQGLLSDEIRALLQDRDGGVWIGTRRGLTRLSESTVKTVRPPDGSDVFVSAVMVTRDGAVWTSTANGLQRSQGNVRQTFNEGDGLPGRVVMSLHEDRGGTLWASTALGVARLVGSKFVPLPVPADGAWPEYQVRSMASEDDGVLWLCDQQRGLYRWKDGVLESPNIMARERKANIVFVDRRGRLWVGFWDGGVAVYDRGKVTTYDATEGLPQAAVNVIFEDRAGGVWVATERDLGRVEGGRVRTFRGHGFPHGSIDSQIEDETGTFWIGVGPALMKIAPGEFDVAATDPGYQLRYRLFGRDDGLPGTLGRPGMPNVARAPGGELLFVTSIGLAVVDPRHLYDRPPPTRIRVDEVSADGRTVPLGDSATLIPARTTRLAFRYSKLSLQAGESQFRHRLEGFDTAWQDVGTEREVTYANLPPGDYVFRLAARHEDAWIESSTPLSVTILPAFYQTVTFSVAAASSIGLLGWSVWRRRVRQLKRDFDLVLAERSRLGREIHDTLLQSLVAVALEFDDIADQLDPTQATVKARVVRIRARVEEYILEARQSISNLRSPMLEQSDLGTALKRAGEGATGSGGIRFDFSLVGAPRPLDPTLEEQLLRIGQEAISNAVRHGEASSIRLELCFDPRTVRLRVSDDGCGFDPEDPPRDTAHWGIAGMRERAERVGARLSLVSQPGAGTTVEALVAQPRKG
jgi:signal transduction histidine kinase/ligand-binding sensor domain-containing protein